MMKIKVEIATHKIVMVSLEELAVDGADFVDHYYDVVGFGEYIDLSRPQYWHASLQAVRDVPPS